MQEEVENRTVNLVVSTTKLTARSLIRGLRWYLILTIDNKAASTKPKKR